VSRRNPARRFFAKISVVAVVAAHFVFVPGIRPPDAGNSFRNWIRHE
jgi:hypothetical protein